jgi:hypothetical protein
MLPIPENAKLMQQIASARSLPLALTLACQAIDEVLTIQIGSALDTDYFFKKHDVPLAMKADLAYSLRCIPYACIAPVAACASLHAEQPVRLSASHLEALRVSTHPVTNAATTAWISSSPLQRLSGLLLLLIDELQQTGFRPYHPPPPFPL